MDNRPLTEDEILAHIGVLLLNVQQFEFLIRAALKQIYADKADLTAEKIFAEDKRTLGKLISDLRTQATLEDDTEALLRRLLRDRNVFVHHLGRQKWFTLSTVAGRDRAMDFLGPFTEDLNHAIRLFVALHVKHADDIGFDSPEMHILRTSSGWRVREYLPHAAKIKKRS
jgi:hypothetical protein